MEPGGTVLLPLAESNSFSPECYWSEPGREHWRTSSAPVSSPQPITCLHVTLSPCPPCALLSSHTHSPRLPPPTAVDTHSPSLHCLALCLHALFLTRLTVLHFSIHPSSITAHPAWWWRCCCSAAAVFGFVKATNNNNHHNSRSQVDDLKLPNV